MRCAALSASAFVLAACGGGSGDVTAPVTGPDGASEAVNQFFEICGTAMNEGEVIDALPSASRLGWELEDDMGGTVGDIDIMRATGLLQPDMDYRLQFFEHDGPHEKIISCQFISGFGETALSINPALFNDMPGFKGRWTKIDDSAAGRWSTRNGDTLLSIQVSQTDDSFTTLFMNKLTLK